MFLQALKSIFSFFFTCHQDCPDAPSAVTGGILGHHRQVIMFSALQLV